MPKNFLITSPSNVTYLSNFTGSNGFMLITPRQQYLFTDSRYIERAKASIKKGIEIVDTTRMWRNPVDLKKNWQGIIKKHKITTLGVEESDLTVSRYKRFKKITPKVKFEDISGHFEEIRMIKSKAEIKLLEKSQQINEKVFNEIKKIVDKREGHTELEIAWKIKELGNKFGAEDVSFDPIVAFEKNSAIPHHAPGHSKLKKNDIVLIDMGMKYKGYCSDMTRMILPPKPTKKHLEIYNLVLKAQIHAIENIKEGITGNAADALSRDIIKEAGYGENYGHAGGHGIGLDIHETPSLAEGFKKTLKANTVVTVEPGIYLPGEFGVRIEDMILITKNGNKNLTKIKK
ncbi:Xaa-Pro dipeptidase [Candidatus Peregrinibacteria bacterium CG10_big_fil_rev_8_21_14_0_10_36_19]|nr:MAG: Xaa-Pro dipeptidase [Candidatus Peregrinibacteria bacterium CG10_big_fil_rev_8_21_14_0_10_36_19]